MNLNRLVITVILLTILTSLSAQNRHYDWSFGVHPSIYSFSAVRNSTIASPMEYNRGISANFSRYINHYIDFTLEGGRSLHVEYPVGPYIIDDTERVWDYDKAWFYDAQFMLKFKLDNGWLIPEHYPAAPFIRLGFGGNLSQFSENVELAIPVGFGVTASMGERASFVYQSTYRYNLSSPRDYMQHSIGIIFHFNKASRKRLLATNKRERARKAEMIAKYRKKRTDERKEDAKERLAEIRNAERNEREEVIASVAKTDEKENEPQIKPLRNTEEVRMADVTPTSPEGQSRPIMARPRPVTTKKEVTPPPGRKPMPVAEPTPKPIETPKPKEEIAEVQPKMESAKPVRIDATPVKPVEEAPKPISVPEPEPQEIEVAAKPVLPVIEEEAPKPPVIETPMETIDRFCLASDNVLTEIGRNINFDSDRSRIRSRMHRDLDRITTIMNRCDNVEYVIIAHADSDGKSSYNKKLSQMRANAVKKYLIDNGVPSSRLQVDSFADFMPIVDNNSSSNKAKNRRIEFKINYTFK